ncbi:hypothetical protein TcasGA2_TC033961 [Tribolium castaneum]|uniref:Uncharacterized protein n=1 Tax=Tribolium castaneum TaxID=7070 RepID=A0A139WDQ6_TRICA|nr:hypothetical protein TcasGA2_TC033961 [Tribolium castaneum]
MLFHETLQIVEICKALFVLAFKIIESRWFLDLIGYRMGL